MGIIVTRTFVAQYWSIKRAIGVFTVGVIVGLATIASTDGIASGGPGPIILLCSGGIFAFYGASELIPADKTIIIGLFRIVCVLFLIILITILYAVYVFASGM